MPSSLGRREFVRGLGFGALGLGLSDALARPAAARAAMTRGRARSCIVLFLWGGPSQIDTFDMKPDAPAEYRGEFQPARTTVPGLHICEHLPRVARSAHRLAVVRSLTMQGRSIGDHHCDAYYMMTGQRPTAGDLAQGINRKPRPDDWPFIGSTVAYCRPGDPAVPAVVAMPRIRNEFDGYIVPGQFAGRLGPAYEPLRVRGVPDPALKQAYLARQLRAPDLELPADLGQGRMGERRRLAAQVDRWERAMARRGGPLERFDAVQRRAFALLTSTRVKNAFNLDLEPEAVRLRYGDNINGQSALLARRLVEAGVPFVCVHWTTPEYSPLVANWDTHGDNFLHLRRDLLPVFDAMYASLLDDLEQRGLLDETLVVAVGEMGRTPRCADPRTSGTRYGPGRDHWINCMFGLLAGGGIRGGQAYGASDRIAGYPRDKPVYPGDLAATIYHAMGIPPEALVFTDREARPVRLLDEGEPLPLF